ncbi:unnamed protein product [Ceratitis capitata]|uniref:(Mediterranean fruit fly) hypothetical protein n=1 Tax=Ceratitis capitata TaxID=7213 RepID=A0A811UWD4_CERCA|nr:unnamed protein product [Ceratitis capitata]
MQSKIHAVSTILISKETYASETRLGIRKGPPETPMTHRTVFGWVLFGKIDGNLAGASSEADFLDLQRVVSSILCEDGFEFRKWAMLTRKQFHTT